MRKEQLIQGWRVDRLRSFITGWLEDSYPKLICGMSIKSHHCCFLALFLVVSAQGFTNPVSAQESAEGEEPTTLEEAVGAVPTEEIAVQVNETRAFFEKIQSEMGSDSPLLTIQERIPETEQTLAALTAEIETLLGTRVT
jgi:hypothetical protein